MNKKNFILNFAQNPKIFFLENLFTFVFENIFLKRILILNTSQTLSFQLETSELKLLSNQRVKPQRIPPSKKTPNLPVRNPPIQVTETTQAVLPPRRNHNIQRKNNKNRNIRPRLNMDSLIQPDLKK